MKKIEGNTARRLESPGPRGEILYFPATQIQIAESAKGGKKGSWKALSILGVLLATMGLGLWARNAQTEKEPLQAQVVKANVAADSAGSVEGFGNLEVMETKDTIIPSVDVATGLTPTTPVGDDSDSMDEPGGLVVYVDGVTTARLTNMFGVTLDEKFVNGLWTLGSEEEVLVWMDLPTDIEQLNGYLRVTYPYEVKAGETGTVNIKLTSFENDIVYTAALEFVAEDDLTMESGIAHKAHGNSGDVQFWNDDCYEMNCLADILGPGKKTYMHFSLYTSSRTKPVIFSGGYTSVGYDMSYDIRAIGDFDEKDCINRHGGTAYAGYLSDLLPLEASPDELEAVNVQSTDQDELDVTDEQPTGKLPDVLEIPEPRPMDIPPDDAQLF